jgi:stage III sporulation protein AE
MLLLCGVLGIQTTLAKGSDTLALRTARFAAGSFLPVVGGSISEALRTVSGSVQYLRSVTGTGAILVLFFSFLPVFLSVLLTRIVFLLSGSAAKLLGCEGEEKILSELASVYGYFLAVIASIFVMTVFSLTLFARCATAGG